MKADPRATCGRPSRPRFGEAETFRQLPPRRPVASPPPVAELSWELVDLHTYAVRLNGRTLGFIDVVGAVFVVLRGARYSRSVEVAQTLVFEDALARLTA